MLGQDISPGIAIPTTTLNLTWHRTPAPPWTDIDAMIGRVNDNQFYDSPAGTLLFVGAKAIRRPWFQSGGLDLSGGVSWPVLYDVTYKFVRQSKYFNDPNADQPVAGWNYLYKPKALNGENWVSILTNGTDQPPHQPGNFLTLFSYGV